MAALAPGACPVWTGSNHDIGRFPTRWCAGDERKIRLALLVLATLPGTVVLYYGDEIGMTDVDVPAALRRDPMTLGGNNPQGNRDRSRTPMRWDDSPSAGFTAEGVSPWLPLANPPPSSMQRSVARQRDDHSSTLWLTRRLLALRRAELAGGVSDLEVLIATKDQWVYRVGPLVVAANFSDQSASLPAAARDVLLTGSSPDWQARGNAVLGPWEGVVAREPD